jgi:ATP-dependent DNA helicase DinG
MIGLIEHSAPEPAPEAASAALTLTPAVFAPGGWLHDVLHLQHRPQQAALANAIARTLTGAQSLLCEAGTGVGKSLAYLIPGLIHAIDTARQFVVSTHTIHLQDQIKNNDLTKCRTLFESVPALQRYAKFKTALLVGKANYLCSTRLAKAIQNHAELIDSTQQSELRRVREWALTTDNGLREELGGAISPEVWEWVNADSSLCNSRNCNPEICPYQRARKRIADANIIIVNHALLLSLVAAGAAPKKDARGILFADDFAVLDEAHRIPDVATDHFGIGVSVIAVEKPLKMLWNPKRNRGLLANYGKREDVNLIAEALLQSEFFFNEVRSRFLERVAIWRQRKPDWIEPRLNEPLSKLAVRLGELAKLETDRNRRDELDDFRRRIAALNSALNEVITLGDAPNSVYWVERSGVRGKNISLNSAPLDVSAALREHLFERKTSAILTSATLSDGSGMERFKAQTGAQDIPEHIEASPFDYRRNMEIYIAADAPAPDRNKSGAHDTDWLAAVAGHCIDAVPAGGTLLLCTSHGDVRKLHEVLEEKFSGRRRILAQLAGTSRAALVQDFREDGTAVLIGTDSFWTGVDVPGPALSQVILVRLPFENPSNPVVEARTEWLQQQGKSPFAELSLPVALIKFRQGIGRLIRKMDDRGRLVILDSRVLTKTYGRHFVAALPHSNFRRFRSDNLPETILPYE